MNSVSLGQVAGRSKPIPLDHGWIRGAIQVGTCLGVEAASLPGFSASGA